MASRSISLSAIILKRRNIGETDRIVTLLTKKMGKIVCITKGVRKLSSSKRAFMEPGNIVQILLIKTKSLPILTQAKLINDASSIRVDLSSIRQLVQILEIFDKLFVEEEIPTEIYQTVLRIRGCLISHETRLIRGLLKRLILQLGFPEPNMKQYESILEYVQEIAERPMKSFKYLAVTNK